MDITQMDTKTYTHIHFAFATVSKDYKVAMTDGVKAQFDKYAPSPILCLICILTNARMVKMDTTAKKILSFGGWSFSTDHDTSPIFSTGVSDANRELFSVNVVQFLKDNKLDGLDFDWEYPGATDIEGSVPGSPSDGLNYLKFLKSVKAKLPSGKTLSIALPASYWYLKGFVNSYVQTALRHTLTSCPILGSRSNSCRRLSITSFT
jgi:chitinase